MKPIVIAGPTGSGKSDLALRLAQALGGEIVNYDSVQIYRGFDIGSAKPGPEDRALVPHHLYDIADASQEFNAADFAKRAGAVVTEIQERGAVPVLVGGTFFYLRAFLAGLPEMPGRDESIRARIRSISMKPRGPAKLYRWLSVVDPTTASRVAIGDRHRVERALEVRLLSGSPISSWERPSADAVATLKIGLRIPRPVLLERLSARVHEMYSEGLVEETRGLLDRYPSESRPFQAIGYKEAVAVIRGAISHSAAIEETIRRTKAYAKRQMTWLRGEQNVHWIDAEDRDMTLRAALRLVEVE